MSEIDYEITYTFDDEDTVAFNDLLSEQQLITPELLRGAFQPTLVRASAGTGKTYQLTARLLKILLTGASPESVLATTFTRKAAGEILTRVLTTLGQAANAENPAALADLQQQVGLPGLPRHVCGKLFHRLLKNIHRLRICTLDSLFSQLARALPFELDLPPGWRLTDEIEEVWFRQLAISNLIDSLESSEIESLVSMLGRGDVKRNVARELIQVVETTYGLSRQATEQAWDQLDVPTRPESAEITRTAGSFRMATPPQKSLAKLLEKMADHLDARDLSPLVEETLLKNIHKARQTGEEIKFGRSKFAPELLNDFDVLYQSVKCESLSLLRSQNHATGSLAKHYDESITSIKQAQASFAFDDIAVRLATVFTHLDAATIQNKLDSKIDHLLLDEFQDTSPVQWQVLKIIAESVVPDTVDSESTDYESTVQSIDPRRSQSFFCVGDTKQAIYGWRGGVAEIFDAVDQQIPGVASIPQDESYRSSRIVLDAVTKAFQKLPRHPMAETPCPEDPSDKALYEAEALQEFAEKFPPQTAARNLPGHVKFMTGPKVPPKPNPADPDGKPIKPSAADIQAALVHEVASQIQTLHESAPQLSIGVLTRTNTTVQMMINALEARGVDVSAEGGNPLDDAVAVRWILSALMMVEHPGDGRWKHHIAFSPLSDCLPMSDEDPNAASNWLRRKIEDQGLPEAVQFLATALIPVCDERETVRLRQLVELTTQFHHIGRTRLRDFVDLVRIKRVQRPKAAAVRVMTVHQSKGLEFDAVFLPEINKELIGKPPQCIADLPDLSRPPVGLTRSVGEKQWHYLPLRWQRTIGGNVKSRITEAMCLLYVAMTRARQGLYLYTPPTTKSDFATKTAAALLYHAWRESSGPDSSGQDASDPTQGNEVLFESGDEQWWQTDSKTQAPTASESTKPVSASRKSVAFRPIGSQPRRHASEQPIV